jgi:lycopene beta-cyclase
MTTTTQEFDYIIVGAGCSGLSLVVRMIQSGSFTDKKILIIDKAPKAGSDKTWCFWDDGSIAAFWQDSGIIYHEWKTLWFKHPVQNLQLDIGSYSYKMIRSVDFERHCLTVINAARNVTLHYGEVINIDASKGAINTADTAYVAPVIFSSVLLNPPVLKQNELYLLQHFRGWWIETTYDAFDPAQADLMNFNTDQKNGCTFLYVLAVNKRKALVEYTLFTEDELGDNQYNGGLQQFIAAELKLNDYRIVKIENGVIPMTDLQFPQREGKVFFIGTAGGQTKASTGYTFSFIQKQTAALVKSLQENNMPAVYKQPSRFRFYDSVLLRILHEKKIKGADVFFRMFRKNKAADVLRFLDNESNFLQELKIMQSSDKSVFIPAAIKTIVGAGKL